MAIQVLDNGDLTTDEVGDKKPITLPDELAEWAMKNHEMILRVQSALRDIHDTLTEDRLWEIVAAQHDDSWRRAHAALRDAEMRAAEFYSPENMPLGAIGSAMESESINEIEGNIAVTLAQFTVINEGLRAREDLKRLLQVLVVQQRMLEKSADRTQQAKKATEELAAIEPERKKLRDHFRRAFRRHPRKPAPRPEAAPVIPLLPKT